MQRLLLTSLTQCSQEVYTDMLGLQEKEQEMRDVSGESGVGVARLDSQERGLLEGLEGRREGTGNRGGSRTTTIVQHLPIPGSIVWMRQGCLVHSQDGQEE